MSHTWTAEIVVDRSLAKQLVEEQFPNLAPASVDLLGAGWDNTVFRINDRFVFRFPRRDVAVPLIQTELRCLPVLAERLAVAIPVPVYGGRPASAYPWPFAGYAHIAGHPAHHAGLDIAGRRTLAATIARFLKVLHATPLDALPEGAIPLDTLARLDVRRRRSATEDRLAFLEARGRSVNREAVLAAIDSAPEPPAASRLVVAHGDLHVGQLLLDDNGGLSGVLDWGDLHLGHPAVDLTIVHQLVPVADHDAFFTSYGEVDRVTLQSSRARAAWHAVALLAHAVDVGDDLAMAEWQTALQFLGDSGADSPRSG
jgi:aminoglycoside phosphotransferase (APT) family kinase protein